MAGDQNYREMGSGVPLSTNEGIINSLRRSEQGHRELLNEARLRAVT